jgi:hypothetical protein
MRAILFIAIVVLMVASIFLGINRVGADADHRTPPPPATQPPTTQPPPTTTAPTTSTSTSMPRAHETGPIEPERPSGDVWGRLAACESGGRWSLAEGPHEGGLQFAPGTWDAYRSPSDPEAAYLASPDRQIAVAKLVLWDQGVRAWPVCGPRVGLTLADAA